MGAQESLGTVILRVITDYRIFVVFFMVQTVATEKGSQASCCGNIVRSLKTHIFTQSSLTRKQQVHFLLRRYLLPPCSFFTSCGEGQITTADIQSSPMFLPESMLKMCLCIRRNNLHFFESIGHIYGVFTRNLSSV